MQLALNFKDLSIKSSCFYAYCTEPKGVQVLLLLHICGGSGCPKVDGQEKEPGLSVIQSYSRMQLGFASAPTLHRTSVSTEMLLI